MSLRRPHISHLTVPATRRDERFAAWSGSSLIAALVQQGGHGLAVGLALAELHHGADERAHRLALARRRTSPTPRRSRQSPDRPASRVRRSPSPRSPSRPQSTLHLPRRWQSTRPPQPWPVWPSASPLTSIVVRLGEVCRGYGRRVGPRFLHMHQCASDVAACCSDGQHIVVLPAVHDDHRSLAVGCDIGGLGQPRPSERRAASAAPSAHRGDPLLRRCQRHQIRLEEVAVVVGVFFGSQCVSTAVGLIPVTGLLANRVRRSRADRSDVAPRTRWPGQSSARC